MVGVTQNVRHPQLVPVEKYPNTAYDEGAASNANATATQTSSSHMFDRQWSSKLRHAPNCVGIARLILLHGEPVLNLRVGCDLLGQCAGQIAYTEVAPLVPIVNLEGGLVAHRTTTHSHP
jgi:hypothetical protein